MNPRLDRRPRTPELPPQDRLPRLHRPYAFSKGSPQQTATNNQTGTELRHIGDKTELLMNPTDIKVESARAKRGGPLGIELRNARI